MKKNILKQLNICFLALLIIIVMAACSGKNSSDNASTDQGDFDTSIPDGKSSGDYYATLSIPDAGIEVKLYYADISGIGWEAQEIVDAEDSAAYFRYGNPFVIGDHDYQEFKTLTSVKKGQKCYITKEDGSVLTYKCVKVSEGYNIGALYDIDERGLETYPEDYIILYTCDANDMRVWMTFWKFVR